MSDVSTALEVVRETPVEAHRQGFGHEQVELIKRTICAGATDDELALFIKVAERTGLDPFARQIHAVKRWDSDKGMNVMSIQVGIDGFRLIAERTHRYAGRLGPYWCGEDGEWLMDDKGRPRPWLRAEPPSAAMVGVRHRDYVDPLYAIATWKSYVQTKKGGAVTHMWATKGDLMLGKCAEALALRGAFPAELSGLYTDDEMGQAQSIPVDPDQWFIDNGWPDRAHHDNDRDRLGERVAALPDEMKMVFKDWLHTQEFGWREPWPVRFANVVSEKLTELASAPAGNDEKAPSTPETPESPSEPPAPAPEPLPEPDPTTMALIAFVEGLRGSQVGDALEARSAGLSGAPKVRQQRLAKLLAAEGWTPGRGHLPVSEPGPVTSLPLGLPEPVCAWCSHAERTDPAHKDERVTNGEGGWMHPSCRVEWKDDKTAMEEPF